MDKNCLFFFLKNQQKLIKITHLVIVEKKCDEKKIKLQIFLNFFK